MKKIRKSVLLFALLTSAICRGWAQSEIVPKEFGIMLGSCTNFPLNQNYLKDNIKCPIYIAPYARAGKHEFYVGIVYPLKTTGVISVANISPRLGAVGGYNFYVFNIYGRENLFLSYMFQFLRFRGNYHADNLPYDNTETDTYINNIFGLGYKVYFDSKQIFGYYYTLGYIISDRSNNSTRLPDHNRLWTSQYFWNHLNTNMGFTFKITSLNKKVKK